MSKEPIERAEPLLPQREREPTALVETPWIKFTETYSNVYGMIG
jgi:hypothetical protein